MPAVAGPPGRVTLVGPLDERFGAEQIQPNTNATLTSNYTEEGPRPGRVVADDSRSTLSLQVQGSQSADLTLAAKRGGMPGTVEVSYRGTSEASSAERCWSPPNYFSDWGCLSAYGSTNSRIAAVTIPATQKVIGAYASASGVSTRTWDPSTKTWSTAVVVVTGGPFDLALWVLPSGRVILYTGYYAGGYRSYFSDDAGATWSGWGLRQIDDTLGGVQVHGTYHDGGVLLLAPDAGATGIVRQLASSDHGQTFTVVTTTASAWGYQPCAASCPDGTLVVAYIDGSADIKCRRIASAFGSIQDVDEVSVRSGTFVDVAICADPDGTLWVFGTAGQYLAVSVSYDSGVTWTLATEGVIDSSSASYRARNMVAVATCGSAMVLHTWDGTSGGTVGWLLCGGWQNVATGNYSGNIYTIFRPHERAAFSNLGLSATTWMLCWLPWGASTSMGWSKTGAGTITLGATGETFVTSSQQAYLDAGPVAAFLYHEGEFEVAVTSGGSTSSSVVCYRVRVANGTLDYRLDIRLATTGFRLRDVNAAADVSAVVSVSLTTPMQFRVSIEGNDLRVWYKRPAEFVWTAVTVTSTLATTGSPSATAAVTRGHITSGTATSVWGPVKVAYRPVGRVTMDDVLTVGLALHPRPSRPLSAQPSPVPEFGDTYSRCNLVAAAGPGRVDETHTAYIAPDYPVENADLRVTGTTLRRWRTTGVGTAHLAYDFGAVSRAGCVWVLAFPYLNAPSVELQAYVGGVWVTQATLSSAVASSVPFAVSGDVVRFTSATQIGRRLWENELVGGWISLSGPKKRRIVRNTAGRMWSGSDGAKLWLEDVDGTEPATGSATVYAPRACHVIGIDNVEAQNWRLRVPTGANADGYFELCGGVFAARILGQAATWGRDWTYKVGVERERDRAGAVSQRRSAALQDVATLRFIDGQMWIGLRAVGSADTPYVELSGAGGNASVGAGDVGMVLRGLLQYSHLPWVAVHDAVNNTSYTDPRRWIVGTGPTEIEVKHVSGRDGTHEVVRTESITIEGYP